ncbi:MAG: histidine phosphatase family protein [Rhodanobacter sp.]
MSGRRLLLIRHGQASLGADDYDKLSPIGEAQSRLLGAWLAAANAPPDLIAIGPRRRHRRTAELCLQAAGIDTELLVVEGLDELDHVEVLARHRPDLAGAGAMRAELRADPDPRRAFQHLFAAAVARWSGGEHDGDYTRSWPQFRAATLDALRILTAHPVQQIWAFTSGGPIAVMVNAVLDAPPARALQLSWPLVNTSMTELRLGSAATSLLTYNTWPHLQTAEHRGLVTLR